MAPFMVSQASGVIEARAPPVAKFFAFAWISYMTYPLVSFTALLDPQSGEQYRQYHGLRSIRF